MIDYYIIAFVVAGLAIVAIAGWIMPRR